MIQWFDMVKLRIKLIKLCSTNSGYLIAPYIDTTGGNEGMLILIEKK